MSSQAAPAGTYSTVLAKEDFKFSSAHFTVFSQADAEPLHGHNYTVSLELMGEDLDQLEFLVEFTPVKRRIRELCAELDESVLLAEDCPYVTYESESDQLNVSFAERTYCFPRTEVRLLPLRNITVESLARHLWQGMAPVLRGGRVRRLSVQVGETAGQASSFAADLCD